MDNTNNTKNIRSRKRKKSKLKRFIIFALIIFIAVGIGSVAAVTTYAMKSMPEWDPQLLTGDRSTFIYDDKNNIMTTLHAGENRVEVNKNQMAPDLANAVVSIEDKNFYNHYGIDIKGILRALYLDFTSGELTQGASTITQQLARNAFLTLDKKWERKVKEIILAFKLESRYTKDEILTMYLNKIPFGAGAYGVQAAANTYFGKDVSALNLAEASLIAGLPQLPNTYNPFINLEKAKNRQKMVLNSMVENGYITQTEAEDAFNQELIFNTTASSSNSYGYYIDAVIEEAINILAAKNYDNPAETIYRSGFKIYTSMDADLQTLMGNTYSNSANFPNESKNGAQVESAAVVIDHSNGEIKALIGGRQYQQQRGFNRATSAYRQPGSVIKPLTVYSPALEQNIMPYKMYNDSPLSIKVGNTLWKPENYDGSYRGPITMRTAVKYSVNTYAVQLLQDVGVRYSFDYGRKFGLELIDAPSKNDLDLAPLALGGLTHGATPVQMAAAYGAIGNGGTYITPTLINTIVGANGLEIYSRNPTYTKVISEQTAWLMTSMMQSVVESGTGTRAKVSGVETAGKTGTSEEYANSWFCGFTPRYSCAVWMGYDIQQYSMNNVFGGTWPAPIFKTMLQQAHVREGSTTFTKPSNITSVSICSVSGGLPGPNCPPSTIVTEYALESAVPKTVCTLHKLIYICPDSGKLAGPYCPNPEARSSSGLNDPTETCDIHTNSVSYVVRNQIAVCADPRHGDRLYRANIPREGQTGGCPEIKYVIIDSDELLPPYCQLPEHQILPALTQTNPRPGQEIDANETETDEQTLNTNQPADNDNPFPASAEDTDNSEIML
ncbi:MAG: PBP1A family penicillin-binding protein [Syntrophomonadaceae bacterium]|nr:PBP1A family penicillin-binding protein [Syntrophomonadaceae bacterium]